MKSAGVSPRHSMMHEIQLRQRLVYRSLVELAIDAVQPI